MKTLIWGITLAVAIFFAGLFVGRATRHVDSITVTAPETTLVRVFIHDTARVCDTVILTRFDTLYIDSTTPFGDIPVRVIMKQDSFPVKIADELYWLPMDISITYRGLVYNYYMNTHPSPYRFEVTERAVKFYGRVAVAVNNKLTLSTEVEGGATLWDRVSLLARMETTQDMKGCLKIGVAYEF